LAEQAALDGARDDVLASNEKDAVLMPFESQVYGPVFARREGRRCVFNGLVTGSSPRGDQEGAVGYVKCTTPGREINTFHPQHR